MPGSRSCVDMSFPGALRAFSSSIRVYARGLLPSQVMLQRHVLLAIACSLVLLACSEPATTKRKVALAECRLPRVATAAQCATVEVPEDRSKADSRKIGIFAA